MHNCDNFYLCTTHAKVFTLLRCIVAFFSVSVFTCGFCYCMEIVGGRAATIVGIGLEIPWSDSIITITIIISLGIPSLVLSLIIVYFLVSGLSPSCSCRSSPGYSQGAFDTHHSHHMSAIVTIIKIMEIMMVRDHQSPSPLPSPFSLPLQSPSQPSSR